MKIHVLVSYPALCGRSCVMCVGLAFNLPKNKYLSTRRDPICRNTKISLYGCRMEPAIRAYFCKVVVYPFHRKIVFAFRHLRRNKFGFNVQMRIQRLGDRGSDPHPLENHNWL